jgi:hypothetical protein
MISESLKRLSKVSFTQVKCPTCGAQPVNNHRSFGVSKNYKEARKCDCPARKALARKVSGILAAHFTVTESPCTGEAHDPRVGGMIDHCMVCMPNWGTVESLAPKALEPVAVEPVESDVPEQTFASYLGTRLQHDEFGKGRVVAVVIAGRCQYEAPDGQVVECATQQPEGFTVRFDNGWTRSFTSTRFFL